MVLIRLTTVTITPGFNLLRAQAIKTPSLIPKDNVEIPIDVKSDLPQDISSGIKSLIVLPAPDASPNNHPSITDSSPKFLLLFPGPVFRGRLIKCDVDVCCLLHRVQVMQYKLLIAFVVLRYPSIVGRQGILRRIISPLEICVLGIATNGLVSAKPG